MHIKKNILRAFLLFSTLKLAAITSNMSHRVMATSPLLYKMIDYTKKQISFEVEPIYMSLYEQNQVTNNIMLEGKKSLHLNQQNLGEFDPLWINLGSNNADANYDSQVTFTPSLRQSGILLHTYENFDHIFFDIKTALVECTSEISITEIGGGNGGISGILNAQQAFSQSDWNYGKIGQTNHVVGLDNIEIRFGGINESKNKTKNQKIFISGFGIFEIPTGSGTKAEWLFEPQVGTNHWGVGLGFEALFSNDKDLKFMVAGNYRYLTPAWETRSFDLINNGPWSRYLGLQELYGLPTAPITLPIPGINYFTQQAYIKGRSQLNLYTRLEKQFHSSQFELSYNFFCLQQESIGTIKNIAPGYGIYALTSASGGGGGVTTASTATINQSANITDPISAPVEISNLDFNKFSAVQGTYVTNTLAARLEIIRKNIVYGFGAAIEAGLSNNALSTWSIWAKFEYLFDTTKSSESEHTYNYKSITIDSNDHVSTINNNFIASNQIITHNNSEQLENLQDTINPIDDLEIFEQITEEEPNDNNSTKNEFNYQEMNKQNVNSINNIIELSELDNPILATNNGLDFYDNQIDTFIQYPENNDNLQRSNDQTLLQVPVNIVEYNHNDHEEEEEEIIFNFDDSINIDDEDFGKEIYIKEPFNIIQDDDNQYETIKIDINNIDDSLKTDDNNPAKEFHQEYPKNFLIDDLI